MGAATPPVRTDAASKKPMRSRVDPRVRALDGVTSWSRIQKMDPNRSYVWTNERPVASMTGGDVEHYRNMAQGLGLDEEDGYRVELVSRDGVKAPGSVSKNEGDPILNSAGQVLMSCPAEFKKLVDSIGSDGQSGQEDADRIESLMITRKGLADHLRGIGVAGRDGPFLGVEADKDHGETRPVSVLSI